MLAFLAAGTLLLGAGTVQDGSWGGLPHGDHPVGFRSTWVLDHARTYRTAFDDGATYGARKSPRPVLVNLWYPARPAAGARPMPHAGYFEIGAEDRDVDRFAGALAAFARSVAVEEIFGRAEAELDEERRIELGVVLEAATSAYRDAPAAAGRYPLVIYHSGAGSSFEDNVLFCEYLASHGYVVAGSAYPRSDGSSLAIDGGRGSAEDMQLLARRAARLSFVDWERVAVAGHSAGAQAALRYAAQPGCVADALVLLDTTQDYYGLAIPLYEDLVDQVLEGKEHIDQAMLVAAGPEASFRLIDCLPHAERTYLTLPVLGHNEYIGQGIQRLQRIGRTAAGSDAESAKEVARTPAVLAQFVELCEFVRLFLDAHLKGAREPLDTRVRAYALNTLGSDAPHATLVPEEIVAPPPFDPGGDVPPTPRQLWGLVDQLGVAEACAVLERFRDGEPRSPIYASTMLTGSLVYELYADGRVDEARTLYQYLAGIPLDLRGFFDFLTTVSLMSERTDRARAFLEAALVLDPEAQALAERLRELEARR